MLPSKNNYLSDFGKGRLFVVSAPSGGGKTTLCRIVRKRMPSLIYSISYTTRLPRIGEKEGIDYFFISKDEFKHRIMNNKWAEWAKVHGNFYGTSMSFLEQTISNGLNVLMDIDVNGAKRILIKYPEAVTIFIMPSSFESLKKRLFDRGTDRMAVIKERLRNAKFELEKKNLYKHIIINDNLEQAVENFVSILKRNL